MYGENFVVGEVLIIVGFVEEGSPALGVVDVVADESGVVELLDIHPHIIFANNATH